MIQTDAELADQRNSLQLVEEVLESLREEVFPKNPRNFEILSERYVEEIDRLSAEINDYLERRKSIAPEAPKQPSPGQQPTNVQ